LGRNIAKTNPKPILIPRCKTGINNLDDALSGGFPTRSMILLGGGPGSGKTILGMTFLANGAEMFGERGMYVSFLESKGTMYAEMKQIGIDLQKLENQKKFFYEEVMSVSGAAMGGVLGKIISTITKNKIKRVVFDSITAVAQAFDQEYQARQVLNTVISKVVRNLGATTLVISERLSQSPSDSHYEEFVADGVVGLKAGPPRELEIRKMRGTRLLNRTFTCTIDKGYMVLKTVITRPVHPKAWEPIPFTEQRASTGIKDMDMALGGGAPNGLYVVFEVDSSVSTEELHLVTDGTVMNFLSQGHGVLYLPPSGSGAKDLVDHIRPYLKPDDLKILRVPEYSSPDNDTESNPIPEYVAIMKVSGSENDSGLGFFDKTLSELKRLTNNKTVLRVISYDVLENKYTKLFNEIGLAIATTKSTGDITIGIARPSLSILPKLIDTVDHHFKISKFNGTLTIQGIKPETPLLAFRCDISKGFPEARLTAIA